MYEILDTTFDENSPAVTLDAAPGRVLAPLARSIAFSAK
jgi:hypothetical protein